VIEDLKALRFAYIPYRTGSNSPGDRRRFPRVAREYGLNWEEYREDQEYDVVYATSNADLTSFHRIPPGGPKLVFEMVDSYLDVEGFDPKGLIRGIGKWVLKHHAHLEWSYGRTVRRAAARADLVVCSTAEQKQEYDKLNSNVHAILDMHDEIGLPNSQAAPEPSEEFHLFWEGIGLTVNQFHVVAPVLQALSREMPINLHLVTDLTYKAINAPIPPFSTKRLIEKTLGPDVKFFMSEWNPFTVRALAARCHLGLIPLDHERPLYRAKPENKLLIMWRLGLPVVTSATSAYKRVMAEYGGPDWSCHGTDDWDRNLREALGSTAQRLKARDAGLRYVTETVSVDSLMQSWVQALGSLLD
jgi:hypothetical protein